MNISSLCDNFDDLHTLLGIICLTETRLKNILFEISLNLNEYAIEHTPTEAN